LSDIAFDLLASNRLNYEVPDLQEYLPLIQHETSFPAIGIQNTDFFGAQTLCKLRTGPLGYHSFESTVHLQHLPFYGVSYHCSSEVRSVGDYLLNKHPWTPFKLSGAYKFLSLLRL
jgi:hypothetical protein